MNFYNVINWKTISVFGKSKIINRSYIYLFIVPILAKLFSKIKSPIELSLGGDVMELMLVLPFSWKLFFFSALAFTIGALIYYLVAPSIIKENNSFGDFMVERKSASHLVQYREDIQINKKLLESWNIDVGYLLIDPQEPKITIDNFNFFNDEVKNNIAIEKIKIYYYSQIMIYNSRIRTIDNLEASFWMIYFYSNKCRKLGIVLAFISYAIGFLLILRVFIQSISEVLKWI